MCAPRRRGGADLVDFFDFGSGFGAGMAVNVSEAGVAHKPLVFWDPIVLTDRFNEIAFS
jgi:hypothetical protein